MIQPANLRLIEQELAATSAPAAAPEEPKVFSRSIQTPAGWPWEQQRAAELDARHGAPMGGAEVAIQLRRLEGWAPGRAARFAAFYVRRSEIGPRLEANVEIAGQVVRVVFMGVGEQKRRARRLGVAVLVAFVVTAALALSAAKAVMSRQAAEQQLQDLEVVGQAKLRQAQRVGARRAQAEALDAADRGASLDEALGDLVWASTAKAPDARIEAWRWRDGLMALEVRGDAPPFSANDRLIQRSAKPVRKRVWLWGVGPATRTGPVAAAPRTGP